MTNTEFEDMKYWITRDGHRWLPLGIGLFIWVGHRHLKMNDIDTEYKVSIKTAVKLYKTLGTGLGANPWN